MSEREELMDIMRDNMAAEYENELRDAADQIIAAGYQKLRRIGSPEEAMKLSDGTWIRDTQGWVACIGDDYDPATDLGNDMSVGLYPLTVLWDGANGSA